MRVASDHNRSFRSLEATRNEKVQAVVCLPPGRAGHTQRRRPQRAMDAQPHPSPRGDLRVRRAQRRTGDRRRARLAQRHHIRSHRRARSGSCGSRCWDDIRSTLSWPPWPWPRQRASRWMMPSGAPDRGPTGGRADAGGTPKERRLPRSRRVQGQRRDHRCRARHPRGNPGRVGSLCWGTSPSRSAAWGRSIGTSASASGRSPRAPSS